MRLDRVITFGHHLLKKAIEPGDIVIDATVGNGHDTKFLAECVGPDGKVYGFDIQLQAIEATTRLLRTHQLDRQVTLFQKGHEHIKQCVPEEEFGKIRAGVFNLGYLPGGDHSIITKPETTIHALKNLLDILTVNGLVVLVIYHGHKGGKEEKSAVLDYVSQLDQKDFQVLQYRFINQKNNPPFLIAIEKITE